MEDEGLAGPGSPDQRAEVGSTEVLDDMRLRERRGHERDVLAVGPDRELDDGDHRRSGDA
jgi:hypothetical protein